MQPSPAPGQARNQHLPGLIPKQPSPQAGKEPTALTHLSLKPQSTCSPCQHWRTLSSRCGTCPQPHPCQPPPGKCHMCLHSSRDTKGPQQQERGIVRLDVSHKGTGGTTTAMCDVSGLSTMHLQSWRCHHSLGCVQTHLRVTPGDRDAPEATTGTSKHAPCSHLHPPAPQICTQMTHQVIQANSSATEITPEPNLRLIWLFPEKNNGQSPPPRETDPR